MILEHDCPVNTLLAVVLSPRHECICCLLPLMSTGECGGYKTKVRDVIEIRAKKKTLRRIVDEEKHLEICGGLRGRIGTITYLDDPMDYAQKNETTISGGRSGSARKECIYNFISINLRSRVKGKGVHRIAPVSKQQSVRLMQLPGSSKKPAEQQKCWPGRDECFGDIRRLPCISVSAISDGHRVASLSILNACAYK